MIEDPNGTRGPTMSGISTRGAFAVLIGCLWTVPVTAGSVSDGSPAQPPQAAPGESGQPEHESPGVTSVLDEPLDGSSVEAFESGLAKVRADAGEGAYVRVRAAIDYLLYYRLEAGRDRGKLYQMLDGLSSREIIDMAARR